jgi:hypothetical protein
VPNVVYHRPVLNSPEVRVFIPENLEDYPLYSGSSHIISPNYSLGRSEGPSTSSQFPSKIDYSSISRDPSPFDYISFLHYYLLEAIKDLVQQSFEIFDNLHYIPHISSPKSTMAGVGGGGSAQVNTPPPPPRIFPKVVARYSPLSLPTNLHDLPENYMKSLPKFIGEGDLTTTEHMTLFDQFADILGIEYVDVYMILFVQTFEGQVRT